MSSSPQRGSTSPLDVPSAHLINLEACARILSQRGDCVQINNLHVDAMVGHTIFGERKLQPVQISAVLPTPRGASMSSSARSDTVDGSTIHYGVMSKEIRRHVQQQQQDDLTEPMGLDRFAEQVAAVVQKTLAPPPSSSSKRAAAAADDDDDDYDRPFQLSFFLPKASAWGSGVRYHFFSCEPQRRLGSDAVFVPRNRSLQLENLRVHTIIGVNPPERKVRQPVVVNVWLDPLADAAAADGYDEVEQIVVKTIEGSAFETLEALSETIVANLFKLFVFAVAPGSTVRVVVEKPLAVLMADGPAVKIERRSVEPDELARRAWDECGRVCLRRIPMPYLPVDRPLSDYLTPTDAMSG
ncbi:MAG: hypothetical protein M1816_001041 [Peltula sp. TS41687]|nr:MAG: hypothetical protein M1816_001041 [Peltula sp. TS41687]